VSLHDLRRRVDALEDPVNGQALVRALRRVQCGENITDLPPALAAAAVQLAADLAQMDALDGRFPSNDPSSN
jgi:hypothetical protein